MLKTKKNLNPNPLQQVVTLWDLAKEKDPEVEANMVLATVSADGTPSARVVLLKEIRDNGIVFYTNYESQKGQELIQTKKACAVLYWPNLDVQVRFNGEARKLSKEESDQYFSTRPRASQIGAWASHQSQVLQSREELEERIQQYEKEFEGTEVPRPDYWGGFFIQPNVVQILARRQHRLHDSYRYQLDNGQWVIDRLSP